LLVLSRLSGLRQAPLPGAQLERRAYSVLRHHPLAAPRASRAGIAVATDVFRLGRAHYRCRRERFNPMSYHNGSVWPHDNALIAYGALDSHEKDLSLRILSGLLDMSICVELHRLPELICGFPRRLGKAPTLYSVACSPQAWVAVDLAFERQAHTVGIDILRRTGGIEIVALR
jgi:hypothetical protein